MSNDVFVYGARVYTMDGRNSVADAFLVSNGRVVAVGDRKEVADLSQAGAEKMDLGGAFVVPGLLDTHPHLLHYGSLEEPLIKLWDCKDQAEIVRRIAERAQSEKPGTWLQATPIGEPHFFHRKSFRDLKEGMLPDRHQLDAASSRHPIVIQAWGPVRPSCMAFNSLALQLLGITSESPDRIGNVWIEKSADGQPTGRVTGSVNNYYCYDSYGEQLWRGIPFLQQDCLVSGTANAIRQFHRQGVTGVYENHMMDRVLIDAYRELRAGSELKMRVLTSQEAEAYGMPWSKPRAMPDFVRRLEQAADTIELQDSHLRFNGVSFMWDGYCYGGAQMMRAPYFDVYGCITHGQRHITPEKAEYVIRFCAKHRLRLNILAMGIAAHDEVLALLERLVAEDDFRPLNWVLVHATTIEAEQVRRYKALNFCHTTSMTFGWGEGDLIRSTMGPKVLGDLLPLRHYFDNQMPVGGASDWGPKNAWEQIQLALTHEFGGSQFRNRGPNQTVTRLEALSMMTSGAAKVMHWPDIGSLATGCHADFAVIDRDPIECPVEELKNTKVLKTVFGGETVFAAAD